MAFRILHVRHADTVHSSQLSQTTTDEWKYRGATSGYIGWLCSMNTIVKNGVRQGISVHLSVSYYCLCCISVDQPVDQLFVLHKYNQVELTSIKIKQEEAITR